MNTTSLGLATIHAGMELRCPFLDALNLRLADYTSSRDPREREQIVQQLGGLAVEAQVASAPARTLRAIGAAQVLVSPTELDPHGMTLTVQLRGHGSGEPVHGTLLRLDHVL